MNISSKDLNMLVVFKVVLEELSASRAAKRLNMSQPSLSHALNKLRKDFDDPLFTRKSRGLAPTPLALSLKPEINRLVDQLERLYRLEDFDGKESWRLHEQALRLVISSGLAERVLPSIVKQLAKEAPNINLDAQGLNGSSPITALMDDECDVVICGSRNLLPDALHEVKIEAGRPVCLVDKTMFPLLELDQVKGGLGDVGIKYFLEQSHVVITQAEQLNESINEALASLGQERRVVAGLPNFSQALEILVDSEYVLTCPERLAKEAVEKNPNLKYCPCPLEVGELSVSVIWHERKNMDPMSIWAREILIAQIKAVCDE